jgi:hypothetical protein
MFSFKPLTFRTVTLFPQELLLALTRRAARSYAHAGRLRSSALLCADVALLALQRGRPATASRCGAHVLLTMLLTDGLFAP